MCVPNRNTGNERVNPLFKIIPSSSFTVPNDNRIAHEVLIQYIVNKFVSKAWNF